LLSENDGLKYAECFEKVRFYGWTAARSLFVPKSAGIVPEDKRQQDHDREKNALPLIVQAWTYFYKELKGTLHCPGV